MAATEPIRDKGQLHDLAAYWLERGNYRNYAMIVLGVCTALRIGDLLQLTWDHVYDAARGAFFSHIALTEKKTEKQKNVALNGQATHALGLLYPHRRGRYIFANNRKSAMPISRVQAWRIIRAAAETVGLGRASPYSLRKSFGYHAWNTGAHPAVLMDIYNHSSYDITRRYLGISQDDRDKVYLNLALF